MNYTPRLPWAGKVLRDEIAAWDSDAKFTTSEVDGLGVFRVLAVATEDAADLLDLLAPIQAGDRRINSVILDQGVVGIRFHTGQIAESRAPFHLARVEEMLRADDEPAEEKPKPKKAPAKKTTKKAASKGD